MVVPMVFARMAASFQIVSRRHPCLKPTRAFLPIDVVPRPRSFVGGLLASKKKEDTEDRERILQEIGVEVEKRKDYFANRAQEEQVLQEAIEMFEVRKDWKNKFKAEERDFIDLFFGWSSFQTLMEIELSINPNGSPAFDEDKRAWILRFQLYLQLQRKLATLPKEFSSHVKEAAQEALSFGMEHWPPVALPDLPTNEDFLGWMTRYMQNIQKMTEKGTVMPLPLMDVKKSPFGPLSSSASFEELEDHGMTTLQNLSRKGGVVPRTKIHLKVVHEALVSPSGIVTMLVEDEDGQWIGMQVHNMKDVEPTTKGLASFPVGAQMVLKNPFLKMADGDRWPILRVEQPFDLISMQLPPLHGNILIVGDGDLGFSAAVAHACAEVNNVFIVATVLDTKDDLCKKYAMGGRNVARLEAMPHHAKVLFEFDAISSTNAYFNTRQWDSIVWNFPYPPDLEGALRASLCRPLLDGIVSNAQKGLAKNGRLYVTLARLQGGTSREVASGRDYWNVEDCAQEAGLELVEVLPFEAIKKRGYTPRRAYDDTSFPYTGAKVHVLRRMQTSKLGESPSKRDPLSAAASMLVDFPFATTNANAHWKLTLEQLSPFFDVSPTAKSLVEACVAFAVVESWAHTREEQGIAEESMWQAAKNLITVYKTSYGELVAIYDGFLMACASSLINAVFNLFCDLPYGTIDNAISMKDTVDTGAARIRRDHINGIDLSDVLLVGCALDILCTDDWREVRDLALTAISLVPKESSAHLRNIRAHVIANNFEESDNDALVNLRDALHDCDSTIRLAASDDPIHLSALYLKGFLEVNILQFTLFGEPSEDSGVGMGEHPDLSASFLRYIKLAEPYDRHVPNAYYHAGWAEIMTCYEDSIDSAESRRRRSLSRTYYEKGLNAEKMRLPIFGSTTSHQKRFLEIMLMQKEMSSKSAQRNERKSARSQQRRQEILEEADFKVFSSRLQDLLADFPNGMRLGELSSAFVGKFGTPLPHFRGLRKTKQLAGLASDANVCIVETRGRGDIWLSLHPSLPSPDVAAVPNESEAKEFCREIEILIAELTTSSTDGIHLAQFPQLYEDKFGKNVKKRNGKGLKQTVIEAATSGKAEWKLVEQSKDRLRIVPKVTASATDKDNEVGARVAGHESNPDVLLCSEIETLLNERREEGKPRGISFGTFPELYRKRFRKPVPTKNGKRLRQVLEDVAAMVTSWKVEERAKTGFWIVLSSRTSSLGRTRLQQKGIVSTNTETNVDSQKLCEEIESLLRELPSGIYMGMLPQLYKNMFGKEVLPNQKKGLRKVLALASGDSKASWKIEERRKGGFWIISHPISSNRSKIAENISKLVSKDSINNKDGIDLGRVRDLYHEAFQESVIPKTKSIRDYLVKLSNEFGGFVVQRRNLTGGWIIKSKPSTRPQTQTLH